MKPVEDLFHQVVYLDTDFIVIAIYTEAFPEYHVYSKRTGVWIGCTNCEFYQLKHEFIELNPRENFIKPKAPAVFNEMLDRPITDYPLSVRVLNCLKYAGINTLRELVRFTEMDLLKFRNFGKRSIYELSDFIKDHNLTWGMNV